MYKINLTVTDELDQVVCELETSSIADLEENLVRKAEGAIKRHQEIIEAEMQMEIDNLAELEDGEGKPDTPLKQELSPF